MNLRVAGALFIVLAVAPLFGVVSTRPALNSLLLQLVLVSAGALMCTRWPACGLVVIIVLTSTVFSTVGLFRVSLGRANLLPVEAALALVLARLAIRPPALVTVPEVGPTAGVAFAGLLLACLLSILINTIYRGEVLLDNLTASRYLTLYAVYFAARPIISDVLRFKRLLYVLFAIGVATAIVYDLAVLTSLKDWLASYPLFQISVNVLYVNQQVGTVDWARVYMPGRELVQLLFLPALVNAFMLPSSKGRLLATLTTLILAVTIVLIFTRTVWITTMVAALVALFLVATRRSRGAGSAILVTALVMAIAIVALQFESISSPSSPLQTLINRFSTVFEDNVQDPNFQYRLEEAQNTLDTLNSDWLNWVVGAGAHGSIGVQTVLTSDGTRAELPIQPAHNGYLSLLMKVGIVGLAYFLVLFVTIIRYIIKATTAAASDVFVWSSTAGLALALGRILANGFTESTLIESWAIPLIALAAAFVERGLAICASVDWQVATSAHANRVAQTSASRVPISPTG
jgi:O-antigen ligase